jgi:hypothetical protein
MPRCMQQPQKRVRVVAGRALVEKIGGTDKTCYEKLTMCALNGCNLAVYGIQTIRMILRSFGEYIPLG